MAVESYTKSGAKSPTPAKLDKGVFGLDVKNHELLKNSYLSYLAESRAVSARAKKRGEVRGGGAKPWRQKGTGRARFGSSRNPVWVGGGVAFGPTGSENYRLKLTTAVRRTAVRQALSLAAKEGRISVIDDFAATEGKTKNLHNLLKKIGAQDGQILLIADSKTDLTSRAAGNLARTKLVTAAYANVYDIVNADRIIITRPALGALESRLSPKAVRPVSGDGEK